MMVWCDDGLVLVVWMLVVCMLIVWCDDGWCRWRVDDFQFACMSVLVECGDTVCFGLCAWVCHGCVDYVLPPRETSDCRKRPQCN